MSRINNSPTPVLLAKLSLARSIGLPSFMRYLLRHAILADSTIIRTDAVFEESARRVDVLILSKHGTCQSCRQRASQVSKRMLSEVILLSTVRVWLRPLVRANTIGGWPRTLSGSAQPSPLGTALA